MLSYIGSNLINLMLTVYPDCLIHPHAVLFIKVPKCTKSTANVTSNKTHRVIA